MVPPTPPYSTLLSLLLTRLPPSSNPLSRPPPAAVYTRVINSAIWASFAIGSRVSPIKNACGSWFMGVHVWVSIALSSRRGGQGRKWKCQGSCKERRKEEWWLNDGEKRRMNRRGEREGGGKKWGRDKWVNGRCNR